MKARRESAASGQRRRFLRIGLLASGGLALLAVSGCSYMDKVMHRTGHGDTRVQLSWEDGELFLDRREIREYTCGDEYLLKCDRAGSKYSCHCVFR
jgi:hypothetical protein